MIKIITLYNSYNVGAFLQAYSLCSVLKKNGFEVAFLDVGQNPDDYFWRTMKYTRNPFEILFQLRQRNKYRKTVRDEFEIVSQDQDMDTDWVIIGSDEMWNVKNGSFAHLPEYFGNNLKSSKLLTYAVSGNGVNSHDIKAYDANVNLSNFSAISARDNSTLQLAEDMSGLPIKKVCDPTILYRDFTVKGDRKLDYEYLLVYAYQSNLTDSEKNIIKDFARRNGLKTVSVSLYNGWCDINIAATPFEFLNYLKYAKYVVTSTFHGTLLSVILNKTFFTYAHSNEKIREILADLELSDRIVDNVQRYEDMEAINYDKTNGILLKLQNESRAWLLEQLTKEEMRNE